MQTVLFILGICFGSFANVLIDRLPFGENVLTGRSRCDFCKKKLRWFELIPILSFFIQGGRCRGCRKKLSWQYPIVEFGMGLVALGVFGRISIGKISMYQYIDIFGKLLLTLTFVVIFVTDFKYEIIPDSMIVLGIIGAGLTLAFPPFSPLHVFPYLLSGIGASVFFFFLYLITRSRGMGLGDVNLVYLLGLVLGFPNIVVSLYTAFLTGALVGIILMVLGKKKLKSHVPFGPFLIFGASIALLFGNEIIHWWSTII